MGLIFGSDAAVAGICYIERFEIEFKVNCQVGRVVLAFTALLGIHKTVTFNSCIH